MGTQESSPQGRGQRLVLSPESNSRYRYARSGADAFTADWQRICDACGWATYFHTPAWAAVARDVYGYETATQIVALPGGGRAVLPLMRTWGDSGGAVGYVSTAPFTYGGIIADRDLDADEEAEVFQRICQSKALRAHSVLVSGNPYRPTPLGKKLHTHAIDAVDLRGGVETVRRTYRKRHRRCVKKASRAGIRVYEASNVEDWKRYDALYRASLRDRQDRGVPTTQIQDWNLFERLRREPAESVKLWLAEREGILCAGTIVFYRHPVAHAWHGAANRNGFGHVGCSHRLDDRILEDAAERGFAWYDLMGSGGFAGVQLYKDGFNPRHIEYPAHEWRAGWLVRGIRKATRFAGRSVTPRHGAKGALR